MKRYAAHPRGSGEGAINQMLAMLATAYPDNRLTDPEIETRRKLYVKSLADVDVDQLRRGFDEVLKTCRFFPTIAEWREKVAKLSAPVRVRRAWQLRQLLAAKQDPVIADAVATEDVTRLLDRIRPAAPGPTDRLLPRATDRSVPTLDDYRAIPGITEEEALEAWDQHLQQARAIEAEKVASRAAEHRKAA